ncbi:MAG TPA: recombinase family protein, partial [Nocardioides sp.]|nr:recombinase family protein [Nocardioides sp.]
MSKTERKKHAVGYVRLSDWRGDADPSTSPAGQERTIRAFCEAKGWEVLDVIHDLDVSGSARGLRLDRPGLGKVRALYDRADVLVVAKLDRLARNVSDFMAICEEAAERNVAPVSVAESLDMTTPGGRFTATI